MDSNLYPDVAAAGSLAVALEQLAAGLDIRLVTVPGRPPSVHSAGIVASVPDRGPLFVHTGSQRRSFGVSGWSQGVQLITGDTADLGDVVKAGVAWGEGRSLRELHESLPFLGSSELAQAHERGPAAAVAVQWGLMREQAAGAPDFPEFGLLVDAAHAEPRLRELYPFSSHWTLGFRVATVYPFCAVVAIAPSHNERPYRVEESPRGDVIGESATAEGAVALAVAYLAAVAETAESDA
ncbi:DUF6193 family natural product biosynthesis protein [Streptacidiphilus sp. N1-12]|uniref:DUF6193 family natural product biosynthesis protein n=2 Tax=Streptacidiphilus alkalitolerans TaxID=3342712 RepID=A0ABV6V4G9_9ACTN